MNNDEPGLKDLNPAQYETVQVSKADWDRIVSDINSPIKLSPAMQRALSQCNSTIIKRNPLRSSVSVPLYISAMISPIRLSSVHDISVIPQKFSLPPHLRTRK
jgi:hypothetical protein